jgi:hypothetical protein
MYSSPGTVNVRGIKESGIAGHIMIMQNIQNVLEAFYDYMYI